MGLMSNDHAYIVTVQFMQKKRLSSACKLRYMIFLHVYFGTRKTIQLGEFPAGLECSLVVV